MKTLTEKAIAAAVSDLCVKANCFLRADVRAALVKAAAAETNPRARRILDRLLENADAARCDRVAICQDTGLPVIFVSIGRGVDVMDLDLERAINRGVSDGYRKGFLRDSVVLDPLDRRGASTSVPGVVHFSFNRHPGLRITVLPKGFGCENKTQLKMFLPTSSPEDIEAFIVGAVRDAGPDACPPYVVGVGIGGSSDVACRLAKEALLRPVGKPSRQERLVRMEKRLFKSCNATGIGPMGLGGKTTVLGVHILTNPTHIAGLPVCVNISCHALRSASITLR
jgi:fumarate hydratase subunit alpha